jgi:Flp pilus assembly protein TadG
MSTINRLVRKRGGDQRGYVAILFAFFAAALLMPLCAISVDVARWYVEVQRVQNAADAAATAGVTYLPDDFASAKATAITVAGRNGYPNSGNTSVAVSIGDKPTQLVVTISSTIQNAFGTSFGIGSETLVRSATADFNGPVLMGSPCNTFGNEPQGTGSTDQHGPSTEQIVPPAGGAVCSANPQLWGAIAGPDTPKGNGDEFMTRTCASGNAGCTGTTNDEFDPQGYFYVVRVAAGAVGQPVTIQLYDPAWVENGDNCEVAPTGTMKNAMNSYTPDGLLRYFLTPKNPDGTYSPNQFCSGQRQRRDHVVRPAQPDRHLQPEDHHPGQRLRAAVPAVLRLRLRHQDRHVLGRQQHHPRQQQVGDLQRQPREGLPPVGDDVHLHPDRAR